jgi:hypothetical protein
MLMKSAPRHILTLGLACFGLIACGIVNVERYYTPESPQTYAPTAAVAVVDGGEDAEAAYKANYENSGYRRIGRVSFVGRHADDESMVDFGKRLGADLVVISRRAVGSRVIDNPNGPADGVPGYLGTNLYGVNEPQFDTAYTPLRDTSGPTSYVVRDYRQVAIYLKKAG